MLIVTTPATETRLITTQLARDVLGIEGTTEDDALDGHIVRASDVIARYCRRVFGLETVAEQFRPDTRLEELILARYPVVTLTSVVEDGKTLTASDYELDSSNGWITRLYNDRPCWWPLGKIQIAYSAGYTLPDETPQALQQACVQVVKSFYLGADRDPLIRSEAVLPMGSASYFSGYELPPEALVLLRSFRRFGAK